MSSLAHLERALANARPPDPLPDELSPAAVRILARVAVLQGCTSPPRARLRRRVASLLGALCLACSFPLSSAPSPRSVAPEPARPSPCPGAEAAERWTALVATALDGDLRSRRCLKRAGDVGRDLLWRAAELGSGSALTLLRSWGRLVDAHEADRAAALVVRSNSTPQVRESALDLLVAEPSPLGVERLLGLLLCDASVEQPVVDALLRLAARGGREEALRALLAGAAAGRARAAAAAVHLGPSSVVDRLLVLAPPDHFDRALLGEALATARSTTVARVLRRAEAGDPLALTWAARARLDGCVPALHVLAVGEDVAEAERALDRLAHVGSVDAWLAVARSSEAPAGARAHALLAQMAAPARRALAERAERGQRDRPAALWALACAGSGGLDELLDLAARPALLPDVLGALERSPIPGAAARLVTLARASDSALPVVAALGRRLSAGREDAGAALLDLGRRGPRRAALEALGTAGGYGAPFLAQAQNERELADEARDVLERLASDRAGGRGGSGAAGPRLVVPRAPVPRGGRQARTF